MPKEEVIEVFIPDEDIPAQQFLANTYIMECLRRHRIPVIGQVGVIGVETGRLAMRKLQVHDDWCLVYRWTGVPLSAHMSKKHFTLEKTLAQAIEAENDL